MTCDNRPTGSRPYHERAQRMRREPIEIGLVHKLTNRRHTERGADSLALASRALGPAPAGRQVDALDEAFAGMSRVATAVRRVDSTPDTDGLSDDANERLRNTRNVIAQLVDQLDALDQQREQLARLLRDMEVATVAG